MQFTILCFLLARTFSAQQLRDVNINKFVSKEIHHSHLYLEDPNENSPTVGKQSKVEDEITEDNLLRNINETIISYTGSKNNQDTEIDNYKSHKKIKESKKYIYEEKRYSVIQREETVVSTVNKKDNEIQSSLAYENSDDTEDKAELIGRLYLNTGNELLGSSIIEEDHIVESVKRIESSPLHKNYKSSKIKDSFPNPIVYTLQPMQYSYYPLLLYQKPGSKMKVYKRSPEPVNYKQLESPLLDRFPYSAASSSLLGSHAVANIGYFGGEGGLGEEERPEEVEEEEEEEEIID